MVGSLLDPDEIDGFIYIVGLGLVGAEGLRKIVGSEFDTEQIVAEGVR